MTSPVCSQCDCVAGCSANLSLCPILVAECIASSQVSAAQHRVLDAAIAQPVQPAIYQFQAEDGAWCHFTDERHYKNTLADGRWPIRALYDHAATTQPKDKP